ncbi:MAG TPA: trypsin-like peptidase domain-containing protein [Chloroflexota bacterium]
MKRLLILLAAASLIVLGAFGEHLLNSGTPGQAAAAKARTTVNTSVETASYAPSTSASISAAAIDSATEHAYAVASQSVVYVSNVGVGTGSGVIYDTQGDIVTNEHVVQGASTLKVTLANGQTYSATLVGTDAADDLAVIRIHASGLTPATFAGNGTFHVAQTVLAIGSPLGLKNSVTSGLISGLGRVEQEPNGAYLPNAIQTSAPINPGNSGGALVTLNGVVVGMPTLEQTASSNGTSAQAIGFAVPSTRITAIANQIIASGKVQHTGRAYMGITPTDSTDQQTPSFGFGGGFGGGNTPTVNGAVVSQISANGPAAQAGVQQGDTITSAGGQTISNAQDLLTILAQKKPGDTLTLQLNRNGSTLTVHVHLGELPA